MLINFLIKTKRAQLYFYEDNKVFGVEIWFVKPPTRAPQVPSIEREKSGEETRGEVKG